MKNVITSTNFFDHYSSFKNAEIYERYLTYPDLYPHLLDLDETFEVKEIGRSFLDVPIHSVKIGNGPTKILGWSQMHGNESTTTKALLDFFKLIALKEKSTEIEKVLEECTFLVIPMLNPDGAARYTRENVNKIDLNRDAQNLKERESKVLRTCYEDYKPHFCFNLHDQRTIFSAGINAEPATVSFLTPSMDPERTITPSRVKSMQVISSMNHELQKHIPGKVGRYDDAFNINCTGDTFQSLKTPTILFEAGHFPKDYMREETRKYMAYAIYVGLLNIATSNFGTYDVENYFAIPQNEKLFQDVVLKNALIKGEIVNVHIQFEEKIKANHITFVPVISSLAKEFTFYGHKEIDCKNKEVKTVTGGDLNENDIVFEILLNNEELSIISQDNR